MKSDLSSRRLSTVELAEVFGITPAGVRRLTRERVLKPVIAGANGRGGSAFYALGPVTRAYLKFINRDRGDGGKRDLIEEQTRKLKLANDERESNVVYTGAMQELGEAMLAILNDEIAGFKDRVPAGVRVAMQREVESSRVRINTAMKAALNGALRESLSDGPETDDDTQRTELFGSDN